MVSVSGKEISYRRLSRPMIGHDGKVYACSEKDLLAFESNGTIAWTLHLNYTCSSDMPPIYGGKEKVCDFQCATYRFPRVLIVGTEQIS